MAKASGAPHIGLDIGSQTIKVVEARGVGSNLQISALGIENTPPGAIQGGMVADPKALGAAIKALIGRSGISAKRTISAATGAASVVVRVIEVPRMSPGELAETMKWEVERHIPFAANDVEMAYQAIDDPAAAEDPDNPNMEVLLAVAQRDMVGAHIETLQAAGLNPVAIDVEPLAAGRACINLTPDGLQTKNVVIINMGASGTDVGIFKSGVLRFPRTIPLAGDNFTRAIADHLGLPMDQAEDEKRENATIFMDLVGAGAAEFASTEEGEPTAAGATPFDTPFPSPFAEPVTPPPSPFADPTPPPASPLAEPTPASPYDISPEPPTPAASPFDLSDGPGEAAGTTETAGTADAMRFDNPFALPPEDEEPAFAPSPAPIPDDPRMRRRREVFDALLPILGEFVTELRRSIDYFRSRYPNDTIDQIILCGGSARLPNLDQFIQADLGIPTVVANPFSSLNVASKQMSSDRLAEVAPAFAVALGLATREAVLGPDR